MLPEKKGVFGMITGIGHTAYNVTDMEKSLDFYCKVLGFTHAFSIKNAQNEPWIEYLKVGGGQFIELFYGGQANTVSGSYAHLCLEVDDIEEIAARLTKMGAPLDTPPQQGKDANWQCWTHDPDGNRIEFMCLSKDSPQWKAYHED